MGLHDAFGDCLFWTTNHLLQDIVEIPRRSLVVSNEVHVFSISIKQFLSFVLKNVINPISSFLFEFFRITLILFFVVESVVVFYLFQFLLDVQTLQHLSIILPCDFLLQALPHFLLLFVLSFEFVVPVFLLMWIKVHRLRNILKLSLNFLSHCHFYFTERLCNVLSLSLCQSAYNIIIAFVPVLIWVKMVLKFLVHFHQLVKFKVFLSQLVVFDFLLLLFLFSIFF